MRMTKAMHRIIAKPDVEPNLLRAVDGFSHIVVLQANLQHGICARGSAKAEALQLRRPLPLGRNRISNCGE